MCASLSICTLVRDGEATLRQALDSGAWADERVVVVDLASRDRSEEIARQRADRVELRPYRGDVTSKRECLSLAASDWVMILDADEVIPEALRDEIRARLANAPDGVGGFEINRMTFHLGRWIRHGDFFPDWVLRVVRRNEVRWEGADPHGRMRVEGRVERLETPLEHYSYRDLADQVNRIQFFSDEALRGLGARNHPVRLRDMLLRPPARFFRAYVLKRGYRDGVPGFIIAVATAFHVFLKYAKYWEQHQRARLERGG